MCRVLGGTARRPAAAVLAPVPVPGLRLEADLGRVPAVPLGLHRDDARLHVNEGEHTRADERQVKTLRPSCEIQHCVRLSSVKKQCTL